MKREGAVRAGAFEREGSETMAYFPFFVDVEGVSGLMVGGGPVALRKLRSLLSCGARMRVVAPEVMPEIEGLPGVDVERRAFCPADLDGMAFVVAATDDGGLNRSIARLCRERAVLVNVSDDRECGSFLFPALVRRGSCTVGVCTGGASPAAAAWLRSRISDQVPEDLDQMLAWLEEKRPQIKERVAASERRAVFSRLVELWTRQGRRPTDEEVEQLLTDKEKEAVR